MQPKLQSSTSHRIFKEKKKVEKTQTLVKGFAQGELHRRLRMFLLEVGFKPSQKVTKDQFSS